MCRCGSASPAPGCGCGGPSGGAGQGRGQPAEGVGGSHLGCQEGKCSKEPLLVLDLHVLIL